MNGAELRKSSNLIHYGGDMVAKWLALSSSVPGSTPCWIEGVFFVCFCVCFLKKQAYLGCYCC